MNIHDASIVFEQLQNKTFQEVRQNLRQIHHAADALASSAILNFDNKLFCGLSSSHYLIFRFNEIQVSIGPFESSENLKLATISSEKDRIYYSNATELNFHALRDAVIKIDEHNNDIKKFLKNERDKKRELKKVVTELKELKLSQNLETKTSIKVNTDKLFNLNFTNLSEEELRLIMKKLES